MMDMIHEVEGANYNRLTYQWTVTEVSAGPAEAWKDLEARRAEIERLRARVIELETMVVTMLKDWQAGSIAMRADNDRLRKVVVQMRIDTLEEAARACEELGRHEHLICAAALRAMQAALKEKA